MKSSLHNKTIFMDSDYMDLYKCNISLFTTFVKMDIGKGIMVRNISLENFDLECSHFYKIANQKSVDKYLPDLFFKDESSAKLALIEILRSTELRQRVIYVICDSQNYLPYGYILLSSPNTTLRGTKEKIGEWSIDFWLHEKAQGIGIMPYTLSNFFQRLKSFGIQTLFAFSDNSNSPSKKVLNKLNFLANRIPKIQPYICYTLDL